MSSPRILYLTPSLFGSQGGIYGGAERYTYELARHMARKVATTLISFGDQTQRFSTPEGLNVHVLGPAYRVRGQEFNRLHPKMIREIASAEIIHCHQHNILASSLTALIARITGKKIFATNLGGGGWDISSYINTDSWYHGHLHISEYSRRISNHSNWNRARVIYGGVDTEKFHPDCSIVKEPLIVYVGRLMAHKGINDLIEGLPEGLNLEIIGRPCQANYFADLQRLAIGKAVRFRQDCDDDEIIRAYRRAIAVVLPSVYRTMYGDESPVPELLGQTLLEGMACGIPAICTSVASLPEVVLDGETGFCVPPNDPQVIHEKLSLLRDRPEVVHELGQRALMRVREKFTWPFVVERCLQAYGLSPYREL